MKRFILGLGMSLVLSTGAYASTVQVITVSDYSELQACIDSINSGDFKISGCDKNYEQITVCNKPTVVTTTEQTTQIVTKPEYTTDATEQTTQAVTRPEYMTVVTEQTTEYTTIATEQTTQTVTKPETTTYATTVTTEATTEATTAEVGTTTTVSSYAARVLELVNEYRSQNGAQPLTLNTRLCEVAQAKAEDMKANSYFAHTSPTYGTPFEMMRNAGIAYSTAAENIAKGQKTPEAVVNAWMNSDGHRQNILNSSFTQMGLGYTPDGTIYWCQMFIG